MHPYSLLACRKKIICLCQLSLDAQFCEYVIEKFVERDTPILTVHDSFVVPMGTERQLDRVMQEPFEHVNKQRHVKAKYNQNLTEAQLYAGRAVDRDWYLDMISMISQPEMAKGYRVRMERHQAVYLFARQTNIHAKGDKEWL